MSESLKLGKLITDEQQRDAVHVAVAPVVAGERFTPGTHVALNDDGEAVCGRKPIGIVDPFLNVEAVAKGQRFWLFLYPGSVFSLRHHWTHSAFKDQPPTLTANQSQAEQWLRAFAVMNRGDYDEMIAGAISGQGYCFGDDDGPYNARGWEFWSRLEELTGKEFSESHKESTYFRCGC